MPCTRAYITVSAPLRASASAAQLCQKGCLRSRQYTYTAVIGSKYSAPKPSSIAPPTRSSAAKAISRQKNMGIRPAIRPIIISSTGMEESTNTARLNPGKRILALVSASSAAHITQAMIAARRVVQVFSPRFISPLLAFPGWETA